MAGDRQGMQQMTSGEVVKRAITTPAAPRPSGCYSQGIEVGDFVFTSGMGPHDPQSGIVLGETIEQQTRQTLDNLEAVLAAVGLTRENVVKVSAHLHKLDRDFLGYDRQYREFFREPYPARTTVGSSLSGILIEVDVIARRS